jgi:DNA-binding transcriptional regulator YiaG
MLRESRQLRKAPQTAYQSLQQEHIVLDRQEQDVLPFELVVAIELKAALDTLELPQIQLAALLGVTTRAVGMWVNGEREIPGPVAAYINLLLSLPKAICVKELTREREEPEMFEGMYRLDFAGHAGFGAAALVVRDGRVFGSDNGGVLYDGVYEPTGTPGEVIVNLTLTVPSGVTLVQGVVADHRGFTFKVGPQKVNLLKPSEFMVATPVNGPRGVVKARLSKLREIPD